VGVRCRWSADRHLASLAGGEPLHLASRVRDASGALVLPEGPRSAPVAASGAPCEVVVPLILPAPPGAYEVEIDPVLEGRWWGSWHGIAPPRLRLERGPGGDIAWTSGGAACPQVLAGPRPDGRARFRIPHPSYGAGETERCVEIPWVLSRYSGERRVLDVGHAHAEPRYVEAVAALRIPALVGLDLVAAGRAGVRAVAGDARVPPFRRGAFELILAVSVVEHVGRDNRRYVGERPDPADPDGDLASVRALAGVLAPGGRMLLTVPFGAPEDHGWFVQYDARRLGALVAASGLCLEEAAFFRYTPGGWRGPVAAGDAAGCRYGAGAPAASAVACLALAGRSGRRARARHRLSMWRAGLAVRPWRLEGASR
jgi:hypothetical protein